MIPRAWLILAIVAALGATGVTIGVKAYKRGFAASEARHAKDTARLNDNLSKAGATIARQAQTLLDLKSEKRGLIDALENEARADPRAVDRKPSADSLRRLERRWRSKD